MYKTFILLHFLLHLLFCCSESYNRQPAPEEQTTRDDANTAHGHGQAGPNGVQLDVMALAHDWEEDTGCYWHGNDVIDTCPAKVEKNSAEDCSAEIDQSDDRTEIRGDENEFRR